MATIVNRTDTFEAWRVKTNLIGAVAGDLNNLDVRIVARGNIVVAVNELQGDIGTIENLLPSFNGQTNLVSCVNQLKTQLISFATENILSGDGLTASVVNGIVTLSNNDKGSTQNIFKKIVVSGQSNVVADNNDDTLTLIAGSNIQITTNATNDSITLTGTTPLANNSTINVTAGSGLTGGGTFTVDQASGSTITITNDDRGSSQNIFKKIVVSGQSNVVADNNDDTLTLIAGQVDGIPGITIATDATTDTITISHANTSSVAVVTPASRTYVTGLTFDTYGHVQTVSTGVETYIANDGTLTLAVSGTGLSGSASFTANQAGISLFTVTSNATAANTSGAIVARDGSGDFASRTITLSGSMNSRDVYGSISVSSPLGAFADCTSVGMNVGGGPTISQRGGVSLVTNSSGSSTGPATSGTTQSGSALRVQGGNSVIDFGNYSSGAKNGNGWIQATDSTNLNLKYGLDLNPNGGSVSLLNNKLIVTSGGVAVTGTLSATGAATLSGGVTVTGTLSATGAATLSGGVTGGLAVTGALSGTSGLTITGAITATGDITAGVSDDRLKDRFENIPNALNKVLQLNGFYYTLNKTAQELGAVNKGQEVGVSAQEVLAVLPEVVKGAPINPEYMTVDYAKMVPLLIEAIKGLNAKVENLEAQLKK